MKKTTILLTLLFLPFIASGMDFSLHKKEGVIDGRTLLIIGGIQGDEPGGFNAASLLVTHYRISKGNAWIVPNLNFASIIRRSRGLHGDMNRKFAHLDRNDPEYKSIDRIKSIILDPKVDLVLNLHDGSGFYRPTYISDSYSPYRWGQSLIIDQEDLPISDFGDLKNTAARIIGAVNKNVIDDKHTFHLKNTDTRMGNTEMEKTLTYFAVRNQIPAFGIEASKTFPTHVRVYYHLLALEAYMKELGIEFTRDFELTPAGIQHAISNDIKISFFGQKMTFDVTNIRSTLRYIPFKKDAKLEYEATNPLIAVLDNYGKYRVHYGNNRVTFLQPQYFEYDNSIDEIPILVDGERRKVKFGSFVNINREFMVERKEGYRVNVIGYSNKNVTNESGILLKKSDIMEQFSVDKDATTYRIEVYKDDLFSGMVLVTYTDGKEKAPLAANRQKPSHGISHSKPPAAASTKLASSWSHENDSK